MTITHSSPKQQPLEYDEESNLVISSTHAADSQEKYTDDESETRPFHEVQEAHEAPSTHRNSRFLFWTAMNIISTVGIVFTNKAIMSNASFHNRQVSLATYHFFITGVTLWVASRPFCGIFVPKEISVLQIIPIAAAMCVQVILQNLSLEYSSVMFHQLARLLLTPTVALLNYILYRMKIPRAAVVPLLLLCTGVGVVTYYDASPSAESKSTTSSLGVAFALMGVCASSIYTVWIGSYHKRFELGSMQLLLNQAPVGAWMLLCAIPWVETAPTMSTVPSSMWSLLFLSGMLACMVNLSQFYIVDAAGAVSGTVIGQVKTCIIVGLGWASNNHAVPQESVVGIVMALIGMSMYMNIILRNQGR